MKVRCIANTGKAFQGYKMPVGYFETSQFGGVTMGREYLVMGISISENLLVYLVDEGVPVMYPFMLFQVTDNKIDPNWYFRAYIKKDSYYPYRQAIWGYYELCFDDNYSTNLLELEKEAVLLYFMKKNAALLSEIKNDPAKNLKQKTSLLEETISRFFFNIEKNEKTFQEAIPYFEMLAYIKNELETLIYTEDKELSEKLYDFVQNFIWPQDIHKQVDLFGKIKQKKLFLQLIRD